MKILTSSVMLIFCLGLFGCASAALEQNMSYQGEQKNYSAGLKANLTVVSVEGGSDTNPLWKSEISNEAYLEALRTTLSSQGLLSDTGKYKLYAKLLEVEQPIVSADSTVTTHVQYILTNSATNKNVLDETITAPYTAKLGDAIVGVQRLRLANEGSSNRNIGMFLDKLSALKIDPTDIFGQEAQPQQCKCMRNP